MPLHHDPGSAEAEEPYRDLYSEASDHERAFELAERGPPSGREVIAAARLFHRVLRVRLNQCFDEDFGLSYAQYEVLSLLREKPNLHAGELGRRLRISRQAVNRLLRPLELGSLLDVGRGTEACVPSGLRIRA